MSASEDAITTAGTPEADPEFELECLYDDMEEPTELTIFTPEGNATASEWITVDLKTAVPVTDIR